MYSGIAHVYDRLNSDVNYEQWVNYIENILKKYQCSPKVVLELGCGTGTFAVLMAKRGYEMICLDISSDMLTLARDKAERQNRDILFLNRDMTDFELQDSVDTIVCLLDGLNHITDENSVRRTLRLCYKYLNTQGIFIFDVNTIHKMKNIYADNVFYVDDEDFTCMWQCEYDKEKISSYIDLTLFTKKDTLYERHNETIIEKGYQITRLEKMCNEAGFECLGMFDEFSFNKYTEKSERVFYVLKKR